MESKKLTAVAYHEAGHVMLTMYNPFRTTWFFEYVTIIPKDNSLGHVKLRSRLTENSNLDRITQRCMISLAGHYAERLYTGRFNNISASTDIEIIARSFTDRYYFNQKTFDAYYKFVKEMTELWFEDEILQKDIKKVAEALLERKKLTSQEVDDVLSKKNTS